MSGEIRGRREWGGLSLSRENLLPFLYKLHYSLHIPDFGGKNRWGYWFMGGVALLWLLDCFVAVVLTLPAGRRKGRLDAPVGAGQAERRSWWARWSTSWKIRRGAGAYKFNFDLHRAGSLWTWSLLFLLALSSVSLNLYQEVFRPVLAAVSTLTPDPFTQRSMRPLEQPIAPRLSYAEAIAAAETAARARGWAEPAGSLFYTLQYGIYGVQFNEPGDDFGNMKVKSLYLDGQDGRILGERGALAGNGGGRLRATPVPRPLRPHPGPARAHPHFPDGPGGGRAVGDRGLCVVEKAAAAALPYFPGVAMKD